MNKHKLIFFDFEVFRYDWLVVFTDYETRERTIIINDQQGLLEFYNKHKDEIYIGYNNRQFDQYIMKGVMFGIDPFYVSTQLINENKKGYRIIKNADEYPMNNFDISTGFHSLKQLEAFMGSRIKETDVSFDIDRKLTPEEIELTVEYCIHDVDETIKVFDNRREEFDSQLSLIEAFELDMKMFNKTKAQLSAHVLGAVRQSSLEDEFELSFPDTLVISDKYKYIVDWYKNPMNMSYSKKLETDVAGVPHVFAWGGIHSALPNYSDEGIILCCDVASLYPSIMIEYGYISRSVTNPDKYTEIRDTRLKLKAEKNPMQLPYKIVLNSTYGAMKDKYNPLFDPLMANNVCIAGQLLLLDLIEKLEPYGKLIQSNTDGLFMKVDNMETVEVIKEVAAEWEKRTRLDLEWEIFDKIFQKDVNNYLIVDKNGKYKSKGAYVKKLKDIDYDLPIINKALVNYFVENKPLEDTINECDDLREFQKIVKVSGLYKHATHNGNQLHEKVFRVFASNDENDGSIFKVKSADRIEKIANTPDKCFIENDKVLGEKVPPNLDKEYYINLAKKRLDDYLNEKVKLSKEEKMSNLIKNMEVIVSECDTFYDVLVKNKEDKLATNGELEKLIKLDTFVKYGAAKKILNFLEYFTLLYSKKSPKKKTMSEKIKNEQVIKLLEEHSTMTETAYSKLDFETVLRTLFNMLPDEDVHFVEKIKLQLEYTGEITYVNPEVPTDYLYVVNLNTIKNTIITAYCINNGVAKHLIIPKDSFSILECKIGDVIKAKEYEVKQGKKIVGKDEEGKHTFGVDPNKVEYWLKSYEIAHRD
mgnify:CR=1 FL=1